MTVDIPAVQPEFAPAIPAMISHITDKFGHLPAVVKGAQTVSYRELQDRSGVLARGLLASGVGKGDRVGILLPNGPDFAVVFLAVTRIGAVAAPLSTLYQAPELGNVLRRAAIRHVITADSFRNHDYVARFEAALPGLTTQRHGSIAVASAPFLRSVMVLGECDRSWAAPLAGAVERILAEKPEFDAEMLAAVEATICPADPICVIHTSGSTADPKGVVHSHGDFIRHSFQMATLYSPIGEGDKVVGMRPFFWVGGLAAQLFYCLQVGACHVTPENNGDATMLHLVREQGAAFFAGDESWHQQLRNSPLLREAGYEVIELCIEFSAVARRLPDGGLAYVSKQLAARIPEPEQANLELLPWTFGMTEFLGVHTSLPLQVLGPADRKRVSGKPIHGVRARIRDLATGDLAEPDVQGELEVRGYQMMIGMDGREPGEIWTDDGFYATGDLASMDADGYITLIGRLGDGFKVKGANVAPLEVELALYANGPIERCCVLGIPRDEHRTDHVIVAVVQPVAGREFDEAAVLQKLKTSISSYKMPHHLLVFAAEDFPVTGSGKVKRSELTTKVIGILASEGRSA